MLGQRIKTTLPDSTETESEYHPTGELKETFGSQTYPVEYTYTPAGRLASRTWARGIQTAYTYNNAGDLMAINYDDTTPDVAYTYNRQGQRASITDGIGQRTFGIFFTLSADSMRIMMGYEEWIGAGMPATNPQRIPILLSILCASLLSLLVLFLNRTQIKQGRMGK